MPDRPITIASGSPLTIFQTGGCLQRSDDGTLVAEGPDSSVTLVMVTSTGSEPQSFDFSHQPCEIKLKYGQVRLTVRTNRKGGNLRISILGPALFRTHFKHDDGCFISRKQRATIQDLTIRTAGAVQAVPTGPGPKEIVIHYEGPV